MRFYATKTHTGKYTHTQEKRELLRLDHGLGISDGETQ